MTTDNKAVTEVDLLVGRRISAMREERQLTQMAVGLELGVSFQQIQRYEKGQNRISASRLAAIAALFEVPLAHFFREDGAAESDEIVPAAMRIAGAGELLQTYASLAPELRQRALATVRGLSRASGRAGLAS